jgi:hypothetical protein
MNRESYPSSEFPLRGDLSAEAGDVIVEVIGLQHIPIAPNPPTQWAVLTDVPSNGDLEWLTPIFNEGNVNFASLIPGDVIVWNGFQWVNATPPMVTLETNGVANGSQSLLNLKSGLGISLTDSGVGGVTVLNTNPAAVINVANQGIFWGPGYFQPSIGPQSLQSVIGTQANNSVVAYQFILNFTISVKHISAVITNVGGGFVSFAIYSADGQTRLIDTGPIGSTGTPLTTTLGSAVVLTPGVYWFAQTSTSNSDAVLLYNNSATASFWSNQLAIASVAPKIIKAGNASVAGQMPTALGTMTSGLSGSNTGAVPFSAWVGFEP